MLHGRSRSLPVLLLVGVIIAACAETTDSPAEKGRAVLEQARNEHGSEILEEAVVEFDFRGDHYIVQNADGRFSYQRTYVDSTGRQIREVLTNDSLYQTVDGALQTLTAEERLSIETTVNSVVYFALLPYDLDDRAVQPQYLEATTITGEPYHEVEVTFQKEGGGRDWQDRFVYWIHREHHTIDYLAYYYHTEGGGSRFRETFNPRRIHGVRFVDHVNYTTPGDTLQMSAVDRYDELFEADSLQHVSEVQLNNIEVRPLE